MMLDVLIIDLSFVILIFTSDRILKDNYDEQQTSSGRKRKHNDNARLMRIRS
jgi:hypothetical protein